MDTFEHWINEEYEQPAIRAIERVARGDRLRKDDWHSLARFVALQDVRTPRGFIDLMRQLQRDLPGVLNQTMQEAVSTLKRAGPQEFVSPKDRGGDNEFAQLVKVRMERSLETDAKEAVLSAEVTLGRRLWIASIRHLLRGRAAEALCDHKWTIAEAAEDFEWPLTDHPVLKLNYYDQGRYDFRGGWGRHRGNIALPLTPKHLLFVEIGADLGRKVTLPRRHTLELRKFLVERAHRWVFAATPLHWVSTMRPREVDLDAFVAEQDMWDRWHGEQSAAEASAN